MASLDYLPYYFLREIIHILLIDDDPDIVSMISSLIQPYGLYSVQTASTARKADELIKPPQRFHICINDLGIRDFHNDEFYILRHYHRHAAFIILTGGTSPAKGFQAAELGAKALIEKSAGFDIISFVNELNRNAMLNIINPTYHRGSDDTLSVCTQVLLKKAPSFVTEWALETGITDRELRYLWRKNLGANAKIILFIFHMFRRAFRYYEVLCNLDNGRCETFNTQTVKSDEYKRTEEYFHCHKSTITDYIAFGNVVNFLRH